jgi:hypothetical protein
MTRDRDWNEANLSENPPVEQVMYLDFSADSRQVTRQRTASVGTCAP